MNMNRPLLRAMFLILIIPGCAVVAQKPELVTYGGILKVGRYESTISYLGETTGDLAVFCFKNNSLVGRTVLSKCRNRGRCEFNGLVKWDDCRAPEGTSATARIVSVKTVRRINKRT